jgi:hypothetical protein
MLEETRVGVGAAPVGSALCDAVDDGNARLASNAGEFGDGLDHSVLRTVRECRQAGEIADDPALTFEDDQRALFGRKQSFDSFFYAHPFPFALLDDGRFADFARARARHGAVSSTSGIHFM